MDNQYTEEPEEIQENPEDAVDIYSRRAVLGFSIFFSTLFGGVLLMINLWQVGYKKAAWVILAFSLGYTLLTSMIVRSMGIQNNFAAIGFNLLGGVILINYFFPKYFPDEDYYPRPIWNALAVTILVFIGLGMLMYYTGNWPELTKALAKK